MSALVCFTGTASERTLAVANPNPEAPKPSLFFYLKQDAKTLSEIVEDFLEAYVAERGGIIGAKKPRRKK